MSPLVFSQEMTGKELDVDRGPGLYHQMCLLMSVRKSTNVLTFLDFAQGSRLPSGFHKGSCTRKIAQNTDAGCSVMITLVFL